MERILSDAHRERLAQVATSNVLLAFDFDGTLAPIVREPAQAAMRPRTRSRLRAVARLYPCVVISGRSRADVTKRVAGLGIAEVIGNHGAESATASAGVRTRVSRWDQLLRKALAAYPGVWVENKRFSVAVHYRQARQRRAAHAAILDAVARLQGARIVGGKQVVNVVAVDAPHKGTALQHARARLGCDTAIYVGDDDTDEDVFALDEPGDLLTVRVGFDRASQARWYVRNQGEVDDLLRVLAELRHGGRKRMGRSRRRPTALPTATVPAGRPAPGLGDPLDFMRVLWAVDHGLQRTSKRMARTLGVTGPQRLVLRIVGRFPGMAAGRLAGLLHIHPSTLTGILARVERGGLLERQSDPRDRRRALLGLTAAGRALDTRLEGTIEDAVQRTLRAVQSADLEATRNVLTVLHQELDAAGARDRTPARVSRAVSSTRSTR